MIFLEILSLFIVIALFKIFGIYGLISALAALVAWQVLYRIQNGHWQQGIDH